MAKRVSYEVAGTHYYTVDRAGVLEDTVMSYYLLTVDDREQNTYTL